MSVHRLRRLLPQLDQLGPDGTWMREGIEIYLATAARGGTLDAALGLRGASGTTPWWRHEQLAQRDELLFELWQALLGELDPPAASREIERQARFYENGQWRRDQHRDRGQMLDSYAKTTLAFRFKMRHIGKIPQAKQLCNFDEWRAAEAKRKTLTEQRQQLSERRLRLERELHDYAANGVATRAAELLGEDGGAAWPPYQALVGEYQALDVELRAVRQAQRVYGERAASLRHDLSTKIATRFAPAHREAVARIAEALDQLEAAMAAEREVRAQLAATGADDLLPAFQLDVEAFTQRCHVYAEDEA